MGEMLIRQSLITERLRPRNFTDELSGCANMANGGMRPPSFAVRDSIEILWYLIPVRCTIELTEKEQWGSYPLFLKKGMPVRGRGLDISMPELK